MHRWAFKLACQLTGKARKAFAAMEEAEASDYDQLKKVILKHYNISGETHRQRLQTTVRNSAESNQEMATRVMELVQKWMASARVIGGGQNRTTVELYGRGSSRMGPRQKVEEVRRSRGVIVDDYELQEDWEGVH